MSPGHGRPLYQKIDYVGWLVICCGFWSATGQCRRSLVTPLGGRGGSGRPGCRAGWARGPAAL